MSVDEMRSAWARMQEPVDQFYDLVGPDLRAGSPVDPGRFPQIPDLLDSALEASEEVRLGANRVLAQARGDQYTEVVRLLLAAATVDAMLARDIAAIDPELVEVRTLEGLAEEGEEGPGTVEADREDTRREANDLFAGGSGSIRGAQPAPDREALANEVGTCIDELIRMAAPPTNRLVGGVFAAAGGVVFEYGASFIHIDLASHLDGATYRLVSRAPRFLREHVRKLITLRTADWIVDEIGRELAPHPITEAVLGGVAAAGRARAGTSQRITSVAEMTPHQIEALRADLAKLGDAYSTECGWIYRGAKWLRRGAAPLVHLIGPPMGSAVLAGVFFLGVAYVAYSVTDRIDARNLGFADRVEGVVKLVDKYLPEAGPATGADADDSDPSVLEIHARPTLVEFPADEPERARRFWSNLLGIPLDERTDEEGSGWQTHGPDPQVGVHERGSGPGDTVSLPYFSVADLDEALERVKELGGSVIHPGSRWAICRDSEGSPFGLALSREPGV